MDNGNSTTMQAQTANLSVDMVGQNSYTQTEMHHLMTVRSIRRVFIPITSCIGLIGNVLIVTIFCMRRMQKIPSSVFLVALAFADIIFLVGEVLVWLDSEWRAIFTGGSSCQWLTFTTYVASFLSVWSIVGFTCERFVAICFPLRKYACSVYRQRVAVAALALIACCLYQFSFWTVAAQKYPTRHICIVRPDYMDFLRTAAWIDSAITMVIPFTVIAVLNTCVFFKAFPSLRARTTRHVRRTEPCKPSRHTTSPCLYASRHVSIQGRPLVHLTCSLLLVSTVFLSLNLPSHVMRLYNLSISSKSDAHLFAVSVNYYIIQEIASLIHYTTFSCNFAIYSLKVKPFRMTLKRMFTCR